MPFIVKIDPKVLFLAMRAINFLMEFMGVSIRTFIDKRRKIYAKMPRDVSSAEHKQKPTISVKVSCTQQKIKISCYLLGHLCDFT